LPDKTQNSLQKNWTQRFHAFIWEKNRKEKELRGKQPGKFKFVFTENNIKKRRKTKDDLTQGST